MSELERVTAERDAAKEEIETEKFNHWQIQQVCNTLQQEVNELRALNLYDLVGDADQFRADMVAAMKERDQLRADLQAAQARIAALEAGQRWVSVEERMPGRPGWYTVYVPTWEGYGNLAMAAGRAAQPQQSMMALRSLTGASCSCPATKPSSPSRTSPRLDTGGFVCYYSLLPVVTVLRTTMPAQQTPASRRWLTRQGTQASAEQGRRQGWQSLAPYCAARRAAGLPGSRPDTARRAAR